MSNLKEEIALLADEVISIRREIHANPELGFQEFKTSSLVEEYLNDAGLDEVQSNVAKTGVVGTLYGKDTSRTVLLRADMDALPIEELNKVPYKSKNPGVMHACGHDGHVAMLLVAAKILAKHRNELNGNVKFVFQPSEEKAPGGAIKMIEDGVLDNPHVNYAFGIHLGNIFEKGSIALKEGVFTAEADSFKINVYGTGGHAAYPHLSVDPIVIASNLVLSLQTIVSREVDPVNPIVVTVGKIFAGEAFNVIPEKAEMLGTVRTLDRKIAETIPEKIQRIANSIASAYRGRSELEYEFGYPPLVNDAEETKFVKRIAESIVGQEKILDAPISMGGEDMAYFLQKVPGAFFWLGSMNKGKGLDKPHHSQYFDFDESVLPIGVELHVKIAMEIFKK